LVQIFTWSNKGTLIGNSPPLILPIFGYVVTYRKIRYTYFFLRKKLFRGWKPLSKITPKNSFYILLLFYVLLPIGKVSWKLFTPSVFCLRIGQNSKGVVDTCKKKDTCLLFFDKLQHIQKSIKSEAEGCLCSFISVESSRDKAEPLSGSLNSLLSGLLCWTQSIEQIITAFRCSLRVFNICSAHDVCYRFWVLIVNIGTHPSCFVWYVHSIFIVHQT